MGKIYLVDSENVGDIWVPLLVSSQEDDEVLVFYTTKSPHMNYENVRMLKETEKEADFIKCFEGSNALDFQLVSELGYRLSQNADREYVIVSNDTGFDAAVRYWSTRKMPCEPFKRKGMPQNADREKAARGKGIRGSSRAGTGTDQSGWPGSGSRAGSGDRPGSRSRADSGDRTGSGSRAGSGDWPGSGSRAWQRAVKEATVIQEVRTVESRR